jgi:hypothetical protein
MRATDKRECEAFGRTPKEALRLSLRSSLHALTALNDEGKVLAMFGVCARDMTQGLGTPWFLGTDKVFDYGRDLMIRGPKIVAWWMETFDTMENVVSAENVKAIRLLRAWGAEIGDQVKMIDGLEFVPFVFRAAIQGATNPA